MKTVNAEQIEQINDLIAQSIRTDNILHSIQFDKSINYYKNLNNWFFYYQKDQLIGVLSIFGITNNEIEISGCVLETKRRKGIFSALLSQVYIEYNDTPVETILLVSDRRSESGKFTALNKGFKYRDTEYTMIYDKNTPENIFETELEIREAEKYDIEKMIQVSISAFRDPYNDTKELLENNFNSKDRKQFLAVLNKQIIGISALGFDNNNVSINNFAISKDYQGKGYAKVFLNKLINYLKPFNNDIIIDVSSDNQTAYNLYVKTGFKEISVIDYYEKKL